MDEMSSFDMHDAGACGGVAHACRYCDAIDCLRAQEIKAATPKGAPELVGA